MQTEGILRGISAPQITPFHAGGSVNYAEYSRLTGYITQNGVKGIFVCGTSGEFANLTVDERRQLLVAAQKGAQPDAKIMFNATALNLRDMKELMDWACAQGADAVSVTPPYYHGYDAAAQLAYFKKAAELAGDMPFYLYNMPGMTHNPIQPGVVAALAETCPNLMGLKDSSMDFMTFLEYQLAVQKPGFELITGNDAQVLTAIQAGGAGAVIAMASVFPALSQSIWDKYFAGDTAGARQAQDTLLRLRDLVRKVMPVMGHKAMLEELGFSMGPARFPMRDLTAAERATVRSGLKELGLL